MSETNRSAERLQNSFILALVAVGATAVLLSLAADFIGVDLTPGFGMIQMFQLLVGLSMLTIAGYLQIYSIRSAHGERSLQADIGLRLGATGLVLSYIAGLSDLLGIGTHIQPSFERPFVGPFQLIGIGIGVLLITGGLLLYYTSRGSRSKSALEFLLEGNESETTQTNPG